MILWVTSEALENVCPSLHRSHWVFQHTPFFSFFLSFFFFSASQLHSDLFRWCVYVSPSKSKCNNRATTKTLNAVIICDPPHTHTFPLPHDPERTGQWKATKAWHYHVKRCRGARTCPIGSAWRVRRPSKIDEKKKKKERKGRKKRFISFRRSQKLRQRHLDESAHK